MLCEYSESDNYQPALYWIEYPILMCMVGPAIYTCYLIYFEFYNIDIVI